MTFVRFARTVSLLAFAVILPRYSAAQTPAFPGAIGFGAYATGGRNGTVVHVTNLNDSGPGSFRDAVGTANRTVVFDVGGYISLSSAVSAKGNITIAGQTAPGGIGFKGGEISFASQNNVICRYIRIRPGSDTDSHTDDCLSLYRARNVMLDHISLEFGPWNNVGAVSDDWQNWPVTAVTFQNCINANPSKNVTSDSTSGQQFGAHTESVSSTMSWFYTIFANSHNRNPMSKINDTFINNVLYNCSAGYTTHTSTPFKHDIVNNYFIAGPAYGGSSNFPWYQVDNNQSIYYAGNLKDLDLNGALNGAITTPYWYQGGSGGTVLASPWSTWTTAVPAMSAELAWRFNVSAAGAFPRDEIDALLISQVKTLGSGPTGTGAGTVGPSGSLYSDQTQTGLGNNGYGTITGLTPPTDTDNDGMPDYWELATDSATNSANALTNTADGYTLLEHYLNWLGAPHAVTQTNVPVDVNLCQFVGGFSASATFSLTNATNGTVSLLNGTNAHFVPTASFSGLGRFDFVVTDGSSSLNAAIVVCVTPVTPPASATQFGGALIAPTIVTLVLPPSSDLVWRGDGSVNTWNTSASNWLNAASLVAFKNGDSVTFDDSGSNSPALNLSGSLSPGSFTFDSIKNYTLGGNGALTAAMPLAKSGTGTLVMNNTNSFSGPVTINDGWLELGATTSAGSGTITLNGGTLSLKAPGGPASYANPVVFAVPATVFVPGSGNSNQKLNGTITGNAPWNVSATGGMLSIGGSASGYTGTMTMTGGGSFRWYNTSSGSSAASFDLGNGSAAMFARDGGTFSLGSLAGGAGTFLRGCGSSAVATTYIIGGKNLSTTFAGQLTNGTFAGTPNSTAVIKTGTGTLTLTGNNQHSGATSVTNGALVVNGSISSSPVTVATAGTLGGSGTIGALVTVNSGGKLSPGNSAGTITLGGGLTLNGGALSFEFANVTTVGSGVNDLVSLTGGTLTLSGTSTVNPTLLNGALANGNYTLISGGASSVGSAANLAWGGPAGSRQTFGFDTTTPGAILLTVSGVAGNLIWRGTNGVAWDASTTNWLNGVAADRFYQLDSVLFDDSGVNPMNVTLTGALWPAAVQVNASQNYAFGGNGALTGSGILTKSESGTLTINTTNSSFTGAINITGGTLAMGGGTSPGSGPITISGGGTFSLPPSGGSIFPSGIVAIPANQNGTLSSGALGNGFSGNIVSGNAASVLYLSGGVSFSGPTSAQFDGFTGTINISPGATLRFSADTTGKTFGSLAPTFVIAGTLQPRDAGNTVQLGAFTGSGSLAGPQSSAGTGNILYVLGGNNTSATFSGVISSNTALAGSEVVVQKIGTGTLTLNGASTYTGGTTVKTGTLRVNNASGSGTGTGSLVVENGATLAGGGFIGSSTELESGAILAPGNSAGTLTFSGDLTLDSGTILNFELGATSDAVVVNGELSAAGIINVTALAGFGPGVYPLFTAPAGSLSIDDLILGTTPAGYNCVLDTGTSGLIKLVVTSATPPVISSVANLGGNLVMSGSNGPALGNYYVLTSTNVGAPLLNWLRLTTNHFDAGGGFNFTNPINALTPQLFYQLQLP